MTEIESKENRNSQIVCVEDIFVTNADHGPQPQFFSYHCEKEEMSEMYGCRSIAGL